MYLKAKQKKNCVFFLKCKVNIKTAHDCFLNLCHNLFKIMHKYYIFDSNNTINGLFLCSDGLTYMLDDNQIVKVLTSELTIEEKLNKLIYKCNNRGGLDNISIAYLEKNKEGVKNDK